jgi:hypothetical protein
MPPPFRGEKCSVPCDKKHSQNAPASHTCYDSELACSEAGAFWENISNAKMGRNETYLAVQSTANKCVFAIQDDRWRARHSLC